MNLDLFFPCDPDEKPLDNPVTDGGYCGIFRTIACIGDSLPPANSNPWMKTAAVPTTTISTTPGASTSPVWPDARSATSPAAA